MSAGVRCPYCKGRTEETDPGYDRDLVPYRCLDCERLIRAEDVPDAPDDGRIRSADGVAPRLLGALEGAKRDGRLSAIDRAVHAVGCQRAAELSYVEIMAGSEWLAEQASRLLGREINTTQAQRSRQRLEGLDYFRRLQLSDVSSYALKAAVQSRKAAGKRPVALIEVRGAPPWPACAYCDGPIPDVHRVSKRYCSDKCRKAHGRTDPRLEAKLDEVFAELASVSA
ncbi:MAG: hypothetical protein ACJ752_14070 [Gaiellaceae bacterium]